MQFQSRRTSLCDCSRLIACECRRLQVTYGSGVWQTVRPGQTTPYTQILHAPTMLLQVFNGSQTVNASWSIEFGLGDPADQIATLSIEGLATRKFSVSSLLQRRHREFASGDRKSTRLNSSHT